MPWLRHSVAGLLAIKPGPNAGPVHVGFVVDKASVGKGFSPSASVFSRQNHSTGVPC